MSFAAKAETPALTVSTPDRRNTFREAESVPFVNGYFRLGPKWITDRFNDHWSNGKTTGQAYCSVAGILCHGPIQHIRAVYAGGDLQAVLDVSRPTDSGDPDYYYTTIEFGGVDADIGVTNRVRVYWGDEAQPADTWLATTSGQDHPTYAGQVLIIFERLHCGQIQANSQARPALPAIEFTGYRLPSPSMPADLRLPAALPGGTAQFRGINLISATWDILTHPRGGLAQTSAILDQSDWITKAQDLEDGTKPASGLYGEEAYVSPVLAGQQSADKIVADALAYIDGWIYTENGKIRIDYFPNDGTIPDPLPEISEADHVEPPSVKTASLAESPTTIVVEVLEGDSGELDLIDAVETAPVSFIREIIGTTATQTIKRPWITSREIAAKYAARAAGTATIPMMAGESVVRLDAAVRLDGTPLRIGDIFKVNYAPMSLLVVARLVEILEDETTATLRWERERGTTSLPYLPAADARDNYVLPDPPTPGTGEWTAIEAPSGLSETAAAIILAERPTDTLAGLRVYLDADNDWSAGSALLGLQGFAAKVTLDTTINSSVTSCILDGTGVDVSPFLGSGVTATEQEDDTLLLLMGTEWMSIGAVSSAGAGSYNAAIIRGRVGSTAAGHTAAAVGWVIRRDRITLWRNAAFTPLSDRYFKILFYHAKEDGPLSAAKSITFVSRDPGAPTSFDAIAMPGGAMLEWVEPVAVPAEWYEIYMADTGDSMPADPAFIVPAPAIRFAVLDLEAGVSTDFWIVAHNSSGNSATVGPQTAEPEATASPTLWPRGTFSLTADYYDNADVKNVVTYGGTVYKTNNIAKDGLDTWDTPGTSGDWEAIATEALITASGIILAETGYIFDTLYIGDGTADKGKIMSYGVTGYGTGADGVFLGMNGVKGALYAGTSAGEHISYYNGQAEVVARLIKLGATGTQLVIDIDSSFVGPNPPARMTFGTMQATANASGVTALAFSAGTVQFSAGTGFMIGSSFVSTYSIDTSTGTAKFNNLYNAGTLYVGANSVALTSATAATLTVTGSVIITAALQVDTTSNFTGTATFATINATTINAATATATTYLSARNAGNTDNAFYASSTVVFAKGVDLHVYTSGFASTFSVTNSTGDVLSAGNITALGRLYVGGGADTYLERVSSAVFNTGGILCGTLTARTWVGAYNSAQSGFIFYASYTSSVFVQGVDFYVYTSGAAEMFRVQNSTGKIFIQGTQVVNTRYGSAVTDEASIIACLKHHGLCPP